MLEASAATQLHIQIVQHGSRFFSGPIELYSASTADCLAAGGKASPFLWQELSSGCQAQNIRLRQLLDA